MKTLITLAAFIALMHPTIHAQCTFDPTVTPNDLTLCPNSFDTLWTEVYESYQWYDDGNIIPGATNQFLVVDDANYLLSNISVEATSSGCTEMSPSVLVDGWAFLPAFVTNGGNYAFNGSNYEVCLNDTITFEFSFDSNIEWTADAIPIPGETNQLIEITSSTPTGVVNYGVCGSPSICPNYIQCLGVSLNVQFIDCGTTGLDELEMTWKVYPNPAEDLLTIDAADHKEHEFTILDALGRVVYEGTLMDKNTVDISNLSPGSYTVLLKAQPQHISFMKL